MKSLYYPKNITKSIFLVILSFFLAHFATAQDTLTVTSSISTTRCGATSSITLGTTALGKYKPKPNLSPVPIDMSNPLVGINAIPLLKQEVTNPYPIDDDITSPIPIGFPFIFYGKTYTEAVIQTNGIVGFGPDILGFGPAFTFTGFSQTQLTIPSPLPPNNYIAGMYADLDLSEPGIFPTPQGTLKYARIGTTPNQKFVVEFKNLRPFGGGPGTASFQIIINEGGTFEVIVLQLSADFNGTNGLMTCGAENIDGTIANTVPGRNRTDWITDGVPITGASPDSWIFSAVTPIFDNWTDVATSAVIPLAGPTFTINPRPTVTTTYRATWKYDIEYESKDITITVIQPTLTLATTNTYCTSTGSATINLTTNLANGGGYVLSYLLNGVPGTASFGISGTSGTTGALTGTASITGLAPGTYTGFSLTRSGLPISLGSGCSLILPTTIVIDTKLATPTVDAIPPLSCPNTKLTLKNSETSVAGVTIKWYDAPNGGGSLLGTGATFDVSPVKTTKYYARRENATCDPSDDTEIEVKVRKFVYAANGSTSTTYCTGTDNWKHFYNLADEIIFSVKGDISTGIPQATINVSASPLPYQSPNAPNCAAPTDEKFEMVRSWDFSLGAGVPIGSYEVRFYYNPAERTNAQNAANAWISTYGACNYGYKYTNSASPDFATNTGFYWFKNVAGNYSAPTYDALHLAGATSTLETGGTATYAEITGITSFSGGSGAVILTPVVPLPVTLLSFSGKRINSNQVKLTWETVAEINNAGFEVEFAVDARNFEKVAFQPAQGNGKTIATYQQNINNTIGGYFRLKQIDKDKKYNYSKIIYIDGLNDAVIRIYPNPTKDNLTIDLGEFKATDEVKATFRNVLGVQVTELSLTKTQTEISLGNLPKGIYMLQIIRNGKMIVEKIVLQ